MPSGIRLHKRLLIQINLGKASKLLAAGSASQAILPYEKALRINLNDTAAMIGKGSCHRSLGRHQEAIWCYDWVLAAAPGHPVANYYKGLSLSKLGRDQEAVACFDASISADPQEHAPWQAKGISLLEIDRLKEAVECFDTALRLGMAPDQYVHLLERIGGKLRSLGRHQEAICCYDWVLEPYIFMQKLG